MRPSGARVKAAGKARPPTTSCDPIPLIGVLEVTAANAGSGSRIVTARAAAEALSRRMEPPGDRGQGIPAGRTRQSWSRSPPDARARRGFGLPVRLRERPRDRMLDA